MIAAPAPLAFRPPARLLLPLLAAGIAALVLARPSESAARSDRATPVPAAAVASDSKAEPDLAGLFPQDRPTNALGSAELFVTLASGDTVEELLERTGISGEDARAVGGLVNQTLPSGLPAGSELSLLLDPKPEESGSYTLQRLSLRNPVERTVTIVRGMDGQLRLEATGAAAYAATERFTGSAGSSLYWSMRSAGVPAEAADEFLAVMRSANSGTGSHAALTYDLIVSKAPRANGAAAPPRLLYAALERGNGPAVRRMKWVVDGETGWVDPERPVRTAFVAPLNGRITSPFGSRAHPILRFMRFHRGMDIAAPTGTPIRASAEGRVVSAGWNGGHGQRVRLVHSGGVETSYSHMSRISAEPGTWVRQGQIIGYVGSTGLSTGPHLHYEVQRGGRLVDPQSTGFAQPALPTEDRAALTGHLRQLLAAAKVRSASASSSS